MPWVKLDDKCHGHRKTKEALRDPAGEKRRDVAAMGLWAMAASWCGDNPKRDGFIPADELDRWDDDWEPLADRLVAADYWTRETVKGEDGFQFVNWREFNPLQTDQSEGGSFGNHKRWHVGRGIEVIGCSFCENVGGNRPPIATDVGTESEGNGRGVAPNRPSPVPSPIPIPSSDAREARRAGAVDNSGLTDDDLDKIARATNSGDRDHAARVARQILDRASEPPRKPVAYVLRAIAAEPERYRKAARVTKATECELHPGQSATACPACRFDHLDTPKIPASQVGTRKGPKR